MDPLNYQLQVQQPFQAAAQGVATGSAINANRDLQQQQQLQLQQQQLGMQRAQAMNQAAMQVAQNPTPQSIAQLAIAFPEMSKQFKDANDMLTPAQQQGRLDHATQVYAAMQSGRPDIAAQLLNDRATALENSGDTQNAGIQRAMAQWATLHPETLNMTAGLMLANAMGPDKFADTFKTFGPAGMEKAGLQNQDIQSQIDQRAGQLALDRDKLATDTQTKLHELDLQYGTPDAETRKTINEAAVGAASQEQSASRLNDLAGRVDQAANDLRSGVEGTVNDAWNRAFGTSNGLTALKQEIARQTKSTAVEQLRQQLGGGGRFTDTDMKVALGSAPSEQSDPALIASYFRGIAKLQNLAAAQQNAQAEWLSQVKHLGPAPRDIKVMGTTVPAGTTYADFARQFTQDKATAMQAQQGLAAVKGRSYLRFATGQPGEYTESVSPPPPPAPTPAPTPQVSPALLDAIMHPAARIPAGQFQPPAFSGGLPTILK